MHPLNLTTGDYDD